MSVLDRVLALLHVPGNGPLLLRIGGDSADEALWEPRTRKMPEWVIELTTGWLREVRTLVRESGARLILDLNLVTASPSIAAQWARAAERALPDGSIVGFEIGNEPDLYDRQYWLAITSGTFATPLNQRVLRPPHEPREGSADRYGPDDETRERGRCCCAVSAGPGSWLPSMSGPVWGALGRSVSATELLLPRPASSYRLRLRSVRGAVAVWHRVVGPDERTGGL